MSIKTQDSDTIFFVLCDSGWLMARFKVFFSSIFLINHHQSLCSIQSIDHFLLHNTIRVAATNKAMMLIK